MKARWWICLLLVANIIALVAIWRASRTERYRVQKIGNQLTRLNTATGELWILDAKSGEWLGPVRSP